MQKMLEIYAATSCGEPRKTSCSQKCVFGLKQLGPKKIILIAFIGSK